MTDVVTRLIREANAIRHDARQRVFGAALRSGDPRVLRRQADRARDSHQAQLEQKRDAFVMAAPDLAREANAALFNTARMAAPHAHRDVLREVTQWDAARGTVQEVKTEEKALEALRRYMTLARRDFMAGVCAGALAERAHQNGWHEALDYFLESPMGKDRGGRQALDDLVVLQRAAAGTGLPEALGRDLPTAQEMLGAHWPQGAA